MVVYLKTEGKIAFGTDCHSGTMPSIKRGIPRLNFQIPGSRLSACP
jgi:hypothetical protein